MRRLTTIVRPSEPLTDELLVRILRQLGEDVPRRRAPRYSRKPWAGRR